MSTAQPSSSTISHRHCQVPRKEAQFITVHPLSLTHMVPAVTDGQVHAEDDEGGRHQVTPRCLPHNDRADAAQQADRGPHDGELQVREQRQQSVLESM